MSTVSDINYREMKNVMKLAHEMKVHKWTFSRWIPENGGHGMSPDVYHAFITEMAEEQKKLSGGKTIFPVKDPLMFSVISAPAVCDGIIGGCSLGGSVLCILSDETVMACRRHKDSVLGKWKKKGDLLNLFLFNEKIVRYREIDKIAGCSGCEFKLQCRGCRAAAYASSGDTFGKDPQCVFINNRAS